MVGEKKGLLVGWCGFGGKWGRWETHVKVSVEGGVVGVVVVVVVKGREGKGGGGEVLGDVAVEVGERDGDDNRAAAAEEKGGGKEKKKRSTKQREVLPVPRTGRTRGLISSCCC